MNDQGLLQEIEEDLSRKRMEALWKEYGPTVIAIAVAIVLATAIGTGWKSYKFDRAQSMTGDLVTLIQETKENTNEKITAIESYAVDQKGKAHAVWARLNAASLALKAKDADKAVALYNDIANDEGLEPFFRQLGDLLVIQSTLDTAEPAKLEARLAPLMKEDSSWRISAHEYAGLLALRTGDKEKAKKLFMAIQSMPDVPGDFITRANDIVRWLEGGA